LPSKTLIVGEKYQFVHTTTVSADNASDRKKYSTHRVQVIEGKLVRKDSYGLVFQGEGIVLDEFDQPLKKTGRNARTHVIRIFGTFTLPYHTQVWKP
jgi:hypothetical protein